MAWPKGAAAFAAAVAVFALSIAASRSLAASAVNRPGSGYNTTAPQEFPALRGLDVVQLQTSYLLVSYGTLASNKGCVSSGGSPRSHLEATPRSHAHIS